MWKAWRKRNSFLIAFLHHSLSDMPAPVKLFEQNDSQDRPVFWSRLSWLSEIPSQTERSKKAKLCVEAQHKSCLNLVIFHVSLAYTANNQRSKTAAGSRTLSFSSLLPQATSANWIFFWQQHSYEISTHPQHHCFCLQWGWVYSVFVH